MAKRLLLVLAAAGVSGCATYQAAPLAPLEIARHAAQTSPDLEAARETLAQLAPTTRADELSWDRLSLLAAAIDENPAIAEARARAASAEASARAARAGPSITLNLTAEYAHNALESSPWLYGATSDAPLDIGARRGARVSSARLGALAARYDYAETVWAARMEIRRALAEHFLAMREVEIGQELESLRARQIAALEARFAAGETARAELERVRAEAAGDARKHIDAEGRLAAAHFALALALGVAPSALDELRLVWDNFESPPEPDDAVVAIVREDALLARADILRAAADYDQAEADLRGAVARQWPEVHIGPGYTWERGLVKLPLSIGLVLPPLDFNRNGVRAAEAHRAEAGAHLERVVAIAQTDIDAALSERRAAYAALSRVRDVELRSADRAAAQADQEIADGAINRVDWCAAQVGLKLSRLSEIDALRRVHEAEAVLENALRRPLEGPELVIASSHGDPS